jgi:hypothetical protein
MKKGNKSPVRESRDSPLPEDSITSSALRQALGGYDERQSLLFNSARLSGKKNQKESNDKSFSATTSTKSKPNEGTSVLIPLLIVDILIVTN